MEQTSVLHTQNSASFVLSTQKKWQKRRLNNWGKHTQKAHCHVHNTHAYHQKKNFLKHNPEPVLLLSRNWSKTSLIKEIVKIFFTDFRMHLLRVLHLSMRPRVPQRPRTDLRR